MFLFFYFAGLKRSGAMAFGDWPCQPQGSVYFVWKRDHLTQRTGGLRSSFWQNWIPNLVWSTSESSLWPHNSKPAKVKATLQLVWQSLVSRETRLQFVRLVSRDLGKSLASKRIWLKISQNSSNMAFFWAFWIQFY